MPPPAYKHPARWANQLTTMLDHVKGSNRYPVDVEELILDYSRNVWPGDRVLAIHSEELHGFEGALVPVRENGGWLIISNSAARDGRRRFTIAHEVGHYLLHRHLLPPEGIRCKADSVGRGAGHAIEKEADEFAAALLMPSHDLRRQIDPRAKPSIDEL
ncbi:ImmA/IrrE family metallo-endopeptidase [Methylobacterium sp. J-092]|uniref:ImmA/IrrE family metallo-endopeptidase n=1 Tax=Methylobacterium sp. J-092 TaxID=2836667 RepID=UPI001FBAB171|nr:ImmA/IrrE family metallo-endopeptidase [Methylobacterium sp. J-092]MCJ2009587.1 ImmA/IrrE family metallo-endopeptidase [Methylobacterium sp. J-092]